MGCYTCGGNPNTWCNKCMPAEDTWVAPVDKLPDVFMGDRDHMYLLPNGDLFILSPDRTRWIKVNGTGNATAYDDAELKKRLTALEAKPDKDTITTVRQGERVTVTKDGNDYTISGNPIRTVNTTADGKEPLVTLTPNASGDTLTLNSSRLAQEIARVQGKTDNFVSGVGVSREGNKVKLTYTLVDGTIKEVEFEDKDTVALAYDDTALKARVKALEDKPDNDKQTLAFNEGNRSLSISNGNSVTLPNDKQTISKQGNKLVLSNGGGEVELPTPKDSVPYDDSALRNRVTALEAKPDNDKQTLSFDKNTRNLTISNGNTVTLPEEPTEGGDNLICNSSFPENTNGWGYWTHDQSNAKLSVSKHPFYYNNDANMFVLKNDTKDVVPMASQRFNVKRNTEYSLNLSTFATGNLKGVTLYFLGRQKGQKDAFTKVVTIKDMNGSPSTTGVVNYHITFNTGDADEGYIRIDNKGTNDTSASLLFIGDIDVYEGTAKRPWRPSLKCAIDSLNNKPDNDRQTLSLAGTTLSISNGNSVNLPQYVSPQDFNNLKNEYNQLKGAFTALLQNLKNSGAWNQTGGNIFEGSLRPDRNIATGNINLFGGTVDGNAFIRTNNGKTENDLAGGIN